MATATNRIAYGCLHACGSYWQYAIGTGHSIIPLAVCCAETDCKHVPLSHFNASDTVSVRHMCDQLPPVVIDHQTSLVHEGVRRLGLLLTCWWHLAMFVVDLPPISQWDKCCTQQARIQQFFGLGTHVTQNCQLQHRFVRWQHGYNPLGRTTA